MTKGRTSSERKASAIPEEIRQKFPPGHPGPKQAKTSVVQAISFAARNALWSNDWESAIGEILERLGRAMDVSRVYLFENRIDTQGEAVAVQRHVWGAPGIDTPLLPATPFTSSGMDRWVVTFEAGETISGNVRDFPSSEQEILAPYGIISLAAGPIYVNQQLWGFLGFDECRVERTWPEQTLAALRAVADIVGAAIGAGAANEERGELEKRLHQAQKLESLGVLAGGIAHDFNNLLMGILGNADLARLRLPDGSPARSFIEDIMVASQQAADLTRQMLAYSGKGRFIVKAVDLSKLVQGMTQLLRSVISKNVGLNFDLSPDLPAVEADVVQLQQVVMNLVTNASDAIDEREHGTVSISTSAEYLDGNDFSGSHLDDSLPDGRYVCLEIADNGCGIDKETLALIFDPFFSTKVTGRGLGLSAVLGIVRGHRGTLMVDSMPEKGAAFKVLIPALNEQLVAPLEKPEGASRESWRGSGTVLLIDDAESVRTTVTQMLVGLGFEVLAAEDGRQGVNLFREHGGTITCVLLDLIMPGMSGEEVFNALRQLSRDIPIIISSGYDEVEVAGRFGGKRPAGFIPKPYRMRGLREKLSEVLGDTSGKDA